jgi:Flp pilus assembly pilin Flp
VENLMFCFTRFLNDERGAVTVDWVVLTAGVVVFAALVMPPIQAAIVEMATYIRDTVAEYSSYME